MREPEQERIVWLAEFEHLHLPEMDSCSIEILIANLDECTGMFVSSYTMSGLLRNYIILNKSLLDNSKKETKE